MKKRVCDIILLALGILSIIFAIVCFIMSTNGELYHGLGTFSRTETMLIDVVKNTYGVLAVVGKGLGFILLISGGVLMLTAIKNFNE